MHFFFYKDTATTAKYTLSLHDALPIYLRTLFAGMLIASPVAGFRPMRAFRSARTSLPRSEEHTSELQSQFHLVCRLLLEKKKMMKYVCLRRVCAAWN